MAIIIQQIGQSIFLLSYSFLIAWNVIFVMKRTISNMAALIVAANAFLLTDGVSAQSLTNDDCIFYSDNLYRTYDGYFLRNNDWIPPTLYDIKSVRVRQGCMAVFEIFSADGGSVVQRGSTTVDNPFFYIPTRILPHFQRLKTACVCQGQEEENCIETTVEYGQDKNTNQRSSSACLNIGDTISIPNLGETTFDNNLGFVTIKADRWYNFNNVLPQPLPLPKYEIRAYQHPGGTGATLDTHVMQARNLLSGNGRTWWAPENVKFSASSLYIERTY